MRADGTDLHLFLGGQGGVQRVGDSGRNLALYCKQIPRSQLAIVNLCPKMLVCCRVDQLYVDTYLVTRALHPAFEDIFDVKLTCDLAHVLGRITVFHHRSS